MDTVDASIPLAVHPYQGPSVNMLMQMRQQAQQRRQQNMLMQIYNTPGMTDERGRPTGNALKAISKFDPGLSMKMSGQLSQIQDREAAQQDRALKAQKDRQELAAGPDREATTARLAAIANGSTPMQANKVAADTYAKARDELKQGGMLGSDFDALVPLAYDPARSYARSVTPKEQTELNEKGMADKRADEREGRMEKHETVMEGLDAARVGIEARREAREEGKDSAGDAAASGLTKNALDDAAARYNIDGTLPPLGMGKAGASMRTAILNRAGELASGKDPSQQRVDQITQKASGQARSKLESTANSIKLAEKTALGSMDMMLDSSSKYRRTGSPLLNMGQAKFNQTIRSDKNLAKLVNDLDTFTNEYVKVMAAGTGQTTDAVRAQAQTRLNVDMPHATIVSVAGRMKKEMEDVREKAISDARSFSTEAVEGDQAKGKTLTYDPATGTFK